MEKFQVEATDLDAQIATDTVERGGHTLFQVIPTSNRRVRLRLNIKAIRTVYQIEEGPSVYSIARSTGAEWTPIHTERLRASVDSVVLVDEVDEEITGPVWYQLNVNAPAHSSRYLSFYAFHAKAKLNEN